MDISSRLIFVSFEQGGGGHRFARVLASLPDVYWYSHPDNGLHPWNIHFEQSNIRQRLASAAHFDRIVPGGKLPPTWDYVDKFFPNPHEYYRLFEQRFQAVAPDTDEKFVYCTHSTPQQLLQFFPNSKIFNLIHDVEPLVDRYIRTTARFPGWLRMAGLVPEDNAHLQFLQALRTTKKDFTVADIWAYNQHKTMYTDDYYTEYRDSVEDYISVRMSERKNTDHESVFNVEHKNWQAVKQFLTK